MKPLLLFGATLTAFGIIALMFHSGIHYMSREEYPRDGPVKVVTRNEKVLTIPLPLAGLAVLSGIGIMVVAARK